MDKEFLKRVKQQAQKELDDQQFKVAVEQEKQRIRTKRGLWDRLIPWTFEIRRKS